MISRFKQIGLAIILGVVSCNSNDSVKVIDEHKKKIDQNFTNKSEYIINVGDTLRIYHSSRATACDFICAPKLKNLVHLKYIGDKLIDNDQPEGCMGCDQIYALTFVAKSSGSDTLIQKRICVDENCSDTLTGFSNHIIKIK